MGGAYDRGVALLEPAAEIDDAAMRASVRHLLALVTLNGGVRSALENHRMLTEEAERIGNVDPAAAAAMHADAGVAAAVLGNCRLVLDLRRARCCRAARRIAPHDALPGALHPRDGAGRCEGEPPRGETRSTKRACCSSEVDPLTPAAQSISLALGGRLCTGQEAVLRKEAASLAAAAREAGAIGLFPYYQLLVADSAYRTGNWDAAERDITEAVEGAEESAPARTAVDRPCDRGPGATPPAAMSGRLAPRWPAPSRWPSRPPTAVPFGWGKAALGFLELGARSHL